MNKLDRNKKFHEIKRSREHYNAVFDTRRKELPAWYREAFNWFQKISSFSKIRAFLEVGCGRGDFLEAMVNYSKINQLDLVGLDFSISGLKNFINFQKKKRKLASGVAQVILADAHHLPFKSEVFDLVVSCEVLEHLINPLNALKEMRRVISKEGFLIVSTPNYLSFPLLVLRLISEITKRYNLVYRQPIDKFFTIKKLLKMIDTTFFKIISICGTGSILLGVSKFLRFLGINSQVLYKIGSDLKMNKLIKKISSYCSSGSMVIAQSSQQKRGHLYQSSRGRINHNDSKIF
ncbi:MAG: class I SAM-dependent methyltransferase [Candidatus Jordarchaeum sp.]|uniref:class I SAM-dependent methyltransferase n=1 Tax=Candidatus Jordarchaeum sp. TaxID=2823881 RepID=UPI00404B839B